MISASRPTAANLPSLIATAFAVGPSVGHLYARRPSITMGGALRLGGFVVAVAGVFALAGECDDSEDDPHGCDSPRKWPAAAAMFGIGAAAFATGMIWDLVTAGDEARTYNRTHISLAPIVAGGGAGLALAGSF